MPVRSNKERHTAGISKIAHMAVIMAVMLLLFAFQIHAADNTGAGHSTVTGGFSDAGDAVIDDTVSLSIPYDTEKDSVFTLTGSLMDQSDASGKTAFDAKEGTKTATITVSKDGIVTVSGDGASLEKDASGKEIPFSVDADNCTVNGNIVMRFHVKDSADAPTLEGKTAVVFESLSKGDVVVVSHTDIEDQDQTVRYPKYRTEALGYNTRTSTDRTDRHTVDAGENTTVIDNMLYENLDTGKTYRFEAKIYNQETKQFVETTGIDLYDPEKIFNDGKTTNGSRTFVADKPSGQIYVPVTFNGFEEATQGDVQLTFWTYLYQIDDDGTETMIAAHDATTFDGADQRDGIKDDNEKSMSLETVTLKNAGSLLIRKQDSYGKAVNGVTFVLYAEGRTDTNDTAVEYTDDLVLAKTLLDEHKTVKMTTSHRTYSVWEKGVEKTEEADGVIEFRNLPTGTYYLEEIKTTKDSKGQNLTLLAEPIKITMPLVLSEQEFKAGGYDPKNASYSEASKSYTIYHLQYTVTDHAEFTMPLTGSRGYWQYGWLGIVVLIGAYIFFNRKKYFAK
ncbi:MAG: VaFE repeat-containing surface-anchored protein [Eubacteriales bacterium]|nr:VaFE repeat-containing surface-anchored protein [Eubacteriales bacterium]